MAGERTAAVAGPHAVNQHPKEWIRLWFSAQRHRCGNRTDPIIRSDVQSRRDKAQDIINIASIVTGGAFGAVTSALSSNPRPWTSATALASPVERVRSRCRLLESGSSRVGDDRWAARSGCNELNDRIAMLLDVRATVSLMKRGLSEILHGLRGQQ
jgi:hypothetical protein